MCRVRRRKQLTKRKLKYASDTEAFRLLLNHLPSTKSLLKLSPAFHPSIPTWLASVRLAVNFIITSSPAPLLPPRRWKTLMTLWVHRLLLLPQMPGQRSTACSTAKKSLFSLGWLTTALTSLSPLRTLSGFQLQKFRDPKTGCTPLRSSLPHVRPLLVLSNTFMNNLTLTSSNNKKRECSMPL